MVTVTVLMNYGLEYVNDLNMDRQFSDGLMTYAWKFCLGGIQSCMLTVSETYNQLKVEGFHADRWLVTGNKLIMIFITFWVMDLVTLWQSPGIS